MWYKIFKEPYFFALPPWGWHRADLKHLIFDSSWFCFPKAGTCRFTTKASPRFSYFLLGSYLLSTLASLIHLDFSLPLNLGPSGSGANAQNNMTSSVSSALLWCWKLTLLYNFWMPMHIFLKIYSALLCNCIEPKIENILRKMQNGFQRNRSTTSQILTIHRILEGVYAKNLEATILFVDFSKAFDSIHRGKMEQILLA